MARGPAWSQFLLAPALTPGGPGAEECHEPRAFQLEAGACDDVRSQRSVSPAEDALAGRPLPQ